MSCNLTGQSHGATLHAGQGSGLPMVNLAWYEESFQPGLRDVIGTKILQPFTSRNVRVKWQFPGSFGCRSAARKAKYEGEKSESATDISENTCQVGGLGVLTVQSLAAIVVDSASEYQRKLLASVAMAA
jgi:hypothetical protein